MEDVHRREGQSTLYMTALSMCLTAPSPTITLLTEVIRVYEPVAVNVKIIRQHSLKNVNDVPCWIIIDLWHFIVITDWFANDTFEMLGSS